MENNTATFLPVRPGVLVEQSLATPQSRSGHPVVTPHTIAHYLPLLGRTVKEIRFEDYEGEALPVLMFDDGSSACVMCDPEGNGPGHLGIQRAG